MIEIETIQNDSKKSKNCYKCTLYNYEYFTIQINFDELKSNFLNIDDDHLKKFKQLINKENHKEDKDLFLKTLKEYTTCAYKRKDTFLESLPKRLSNNYPNKRSNSDNYKELSKQNLTDINLSNCNLAQMDLSNAKLIKANFSNAYLAEANFANADLSEANFSNSNLICANFSNAVYRGANFSDANLFDTNIGIKNL